MNIRVYFDGPGWGIWAKIRHISFYAITCEEEVGIGLGAQMLDLKKTMKSWVSRYRASRAHK